MTASPDLARLQLVVLHASASNPDAATEVASTIVDKAIAAEAWKIVTRLNANLQRFGAAVSSLGIALQHEPGSRTLRLEHALLLERAGLTDRSLVALESLARETIDSPELLVHLARALAFADRGHEALARLEQGLTRWPADAALHEQLARLRFAQGDAHGFTQRLEEAIRAFPQELKLRLVAAGLLRNAGFADRALELLRAGLLAAPDSAVFLTSTGVLLDERDGSDEALVLMRKAVQLAPQSGNARRNLIPALLRRGLHEEARALCVELLHKEPDDQKLIAYHATSLRALGDTSYHWLHDYRRLVRTYGLRAPPAYASLEEFLGAFARELSILHRTEQRPLDQSLRGGSQTERNLPTDNPVVAAFFAMIDDPIRDYISRLRDDDRVHPTDRRKAAGYRVSGSWSVRLMPGGFHVNHVHPRGWISSAFYVEIPASQGQSPERQGWLKFGEPDGSYANVGADYWVEPAKGLLVLFPSYLWHGTVPFEAGGRRLTAAFDVVPA